MRALFANKKHGSILVGGKELCGTMVKKGVMLPVSTLVVEQLTLATTLSHETHLFLWLGLCMLKSFGTPRLLHSCEIGSHCRCATAMGA